jgi:hypothetical protein
VSASERLQARLDVLIRLTRAEEIRLGFILAAAGALTQLITPSKMPGGRLEIFQILIVIALVVATYGLLPRRVPAFGPLARSEKSVLMAWAEDGKGPFGSEGLTDAVLAQSRILHLKFRAARLSGWMTLLAMLFWLGSGLG